MDAELLLKRRIILAESVFAELVIWRLPRMLPGSTHPYKYRLALVADGICVLRYDNEAGKGDHVHRGRVRSRLSICRYRCFAERLPDRCGELDR